MIGEGKEECNSSSNSSVIIIYDTRDIQHVREIIFSRKKSMGLIVCRFYIIAVIRDDIDAREQSHGKVTPF